MCVTTAVRRSRYPSGTVFRRFRNFRRIFRGSNLPLPVLSVAVNRRGTRVAALGRPKRPKEKRQRVTEV